MKDIITIASAQEILEPLNVLKELVLAAVSVVGVFIIIKGITTFVDGLNGKDATAQKEGVFTIAGGLMLAAIGAILTWMGIS